MTFRNFSRSTVFLIVASSVAARAGDEPLDFTEPPADPKAITISDAGWESKLTLPGWLAGIEGTTGVRGLETEVSAGFDDILENLDMIAAGTLEVRRGKLGFILDGLYIDASVGGTPPGPLLSNVNVGVEQVLLEGAVTYRLFENDRAWLDLIGGARYTYLGLDLGLTVDDAGVRRASEDLSGRIADRAVEAARDEVRRRLPAIQADLKQRVTSIVQTRVDRARGRLDGVVDEARGEIEERVIERTGEIRGVIRDRIDQGIGFERPGLLPKRIGDKVADQLRDSLREFAVAAAEERVAAARAEAAAARVATRDQLERKLSAAKRKVRNKAEQRVAAAEARVRNEAEKALAKAEAKLARAIESEIKRVLPNETVSGSASWVDPFIGLRGRCDLCEDWYLALRGDVGGFGINSDLTLNFFGAVGFEINDRASIEMGYRYYQVDYRKGGFTYDVATRGPFVGVGIEF